MKCEYCKEDFEDSYEIGKTYEGIDEHHSPPEFMMEKWKGEIIPLCRKHHRELHDEIIKIINKHSNALKFVKSEHWAWIKIIPNQRQDVIDEVIKFTKRWLKGDTC